MLERYAMKVARTVLRGGSDSNATPLPDYRTAGGLRVLSLIQARNLVPFRWLVLPAAGTQAVGTPIAK